MSEDSDQPKWRDLGQECWATWKLLAALRSHLCCDGIYRNSSTFEWPWLLISNPSSTLLVAPLEELIGLPDMVWMVLCSAWASSLHRVDVHVLCLSRKVVTLSPNRPCLLFWNWKKEKNACLFIFSLEQITRSCWVVAYKGFYSYQSGVHSLLGGTRMYILEIFSFKGVTWTILSEFTRK